MRISPFYPAKKTNAMQEEFLKDRNVLVPPRNASTPKERRQVFDQLMTLYQAHDIFRVERLEDGDDWGYQLNGEPL